ncbi:DUF1501 domain-containing protein [Rhodobacter capsulatus]|jgi:uncharacterized protein (DUF1501 family)|uniref:DUF1501 domain-containing protein n=1 Tax=Rhodobacter capsulatus (strain ATCC BAA-309 / NBRC 16581 / SB1003) TaxID=272942 RepID=D5AN10_RHOCB|nr:DUF1501 domain-containing protein [Rhodobacter capsulatus]ADE84299.1 protein of unknown function DUF1501 [Rhodobacter capsulatus SB 1003]MDS0925983.1 DUF1501 domain-containing protein [Rhodobacter capsulatus]TQD35990.1 DUF1501 domain-containing protein [Rhodobacter capsulatus]
MLTRRFLLKGALLAGCSAAAHPLMNAVTFAAVPGDRRLVVIILRGGMDGLDIVQPHGDPMLAQLRPGFAIGPAAGAADLDGFFGLHPLLVPKLMPMWAAGELGFAQAVSTPYRDKRSHFDGQDMLEAGTGMDVPVSRIRDGWLNRLLQTLPGATAETAYSVGEEELRILSGAAPTMSWTPEAWLGLSSQGRRLLESIYHDDPLFRDAAEDALRMTAPEAQMAGDDSAPAPRRRPAKPEAVKVPGRDPLAAFAAERLRGAARIAAFSLTGWDTHRGQVNALRRPAEQLAAALTTLKSELGPVWGETLVLAMTEFGRTARQNGSGGTDHGTGGALVMAGGALKGGKVYGRWPGLAEADLYAGRDLMPTADSRAYAAWALAGLFGTPRAALEGAIFPGLEMGTDPRFLA